jgi:F-type H+-transporting ATPase subunit b
MDVLAVKPGLFFWTLINFGVLAFILIKFALPAITKSLKEREDLIQGSIDAANEANAKSQAMLAEANEKLANAQNEVSSIISKGKEQAEVIKNSIIAEAEAAKQTKISEALREIERNRDNAIAELRKEVADLVFEATEKILNQKLDKDAHLQLINDSISQLKKN